MIHFLGVVFRSTEAALQSRRQLVLENLALRHQRSVLQVASHRRPRLTNLDRAFWTILRRRWSEWKRSLVIVHHDRDPVSTSCEWTGRLLLKDEARFS